MWELAEFIQVVLRLGVKWWMFVNTDEHTKEATKGLFLAQLKVFTIYASLKRLHAYSRFLTCIIWTEKKTNSTVIHASAEILKERTAFFLKYPSQNTFRRTEKTHDSKIHRLLAYNRIRALQITKRQCSTPGCGFPQARSVKLTLML